MFGFTTAGVGVAVAGIEDWLCDSMMGLVGVPFLPGLTLGSTTPSRRSTFILLLEVEVELCIMFLPNICDDDCCESTPFSMMGGRYIGVMRLRPSVVRTSICLSKGPLTGMIESIGLWCPFMIGDSP